MPNADRTVQSVTTGTITQPVTATFHAPLSLDLSTEMSPDGLPLTVTNYKARLSAIYIHVHSIAAGATTLTLRVCPDATCDEAIVPDTTAIIATGYTNATRGAVVFKVDAAIALLSDTVYFSIKTNVGTCNLKELKMTYERGI